ncbi:MAG: hypothetical protein ACRBFS_25095 [Aureispira sp.]
MNIPILIAACITSLAFVAHTFVGTQEALKTAPKKLKTTVEDKIQQHWLQSMGAFQMVTIDLLLVSLILWALALTNWIPMEREVTLLLSAWFFLWGIAWLVQLLFLTKDKKDYLLLGQWLFWLVNAALLYWSV